MMKLSEAVRQGISEILLTNEYWFEFDDDGGEVCSGCLVGAALHGACIKRDVIAGIVEDNYKVIYQFWPWTDSVKTAGEGDMADVLTRLCRGYLAGTRSLDEIVSIIDGLEARYNPQLTLEPVKVAETLEAAAAA